MKTTTGIWALDIVLDTCVDDTLKVVYGVLLKILLTRNHTAQHVGMCEQLCSESDASVACVSASSSVLTRVRVITSNTTLLETRSENIAFSTTPQTRYFISVQVLAL